MSMVVGLTERAEGELDAAYMWWAENRSAEQAARWFNGMAETIESLVDRPSQWPLAREDDRASYELRERHFGVGSNPSHRILFTIRPELVLVLSIRHVAQQDFDPESD